MIERAVSRLYAALGRRYRYAVLVGEAGASVAIAVLAILLMSTFYDPPAGRLLAVVATAVVTTSLAVAFSSWRASPALRTIDRWRSTPMPTPRETVAAWEVASTFTLRQYRRSSGLVNAFAVLPTAAVAGVAWDIGWTGVATVLLAAVIPALYATVVSFSVGEILAAPLIDEIAHQLPDDFAFTARGLPLTKRLRISVPAYTTATGVTTAALLGGQRGSGDLALAVVVSLGVGLALSLELTNILTASITRPIGEVRQQLRRVRAEDFDARALVRSSDELGELAHDFNLMASGLAEREQMREAFGTYVDKSVVQVILSGQFPQEGVEVDVSILFVDVRGFTAYAEQADATEVIASLNALFSEMVPVVEAYGGHVDKFMGDGLMAVFGAPEAHADHADRAVDAARMIVDAVALGRSGLRIAAGVNSGRVVAGPLGGAGRFNFSVIGDAVNVAARVEAATRETGDDVLITAATRDLLTRPQPLVSRGAVAMKGKSEPMEVFTPVSPPADPADDHGVEAEPTGSGREAVGTLLEE